MWDMSCSYHPPCHWLSIGGIHTHGHTSDMPMVAALFQKQPIKQGTIVSYRVHIRKNNFQGATMKLVSLAQDHKGLVTHNTNT